MDGLSTAITSLMGIVESLLTSILANPVLVVIFAGGFVGLALSVLRQVISTSKSI